VRGPREGERGDLEAVEEEAGAFGVEGVAGDAAENLEDCALDAGGAVDGRELEGHVRGVCGVAGGDRGAAAAGVVVVAEGFTAEAGRAAAVAFGVDVAALEAGWFGLGHGVYPPRGILTLRSCKQDG
jgi:hypothetical protein